MNHELREWVGRNQGKEVTLQEAAKFFMAMRAEYQRQNDAGELDHKDIGKHLRILKTTHGGLFLARGSHSKVEVSFFHDAASYNIGNLRLKGQEEIDSALDILTPFIRYLDGLNSKYQPEEEKVSLEVLPNPNFDGERWYLGQGIVVGEGDRGYQAFRVRNCSVHQNVRLQPLSDRNYRSIGEALEQEAGDKWLGTVAIVKGAKLDDKVISTVERMYAKELFK